MTTPRTREALRQLLLSSMAGADRSARKLSLKGDEIAASCFSGEAHGYRQVLEWLDENPETLLASLPVPEGQTPQSQREGDYLSGHGIQTARDAFPKDGGW